MDNLKLRNGKVFYYVGMAILLILIVALIVSLIGFRSFLSHRILPFTLLFLFTIGAMLCDYLEKSIKRKRYNEILENVNKLSDDELVVAMKELFKRAGYKVKNTKDKHFKFKMIRSGKVYYFSLGRNKPNMVSKGNQYIYLYKGVKDKKIESNKNDNLIILDVEDLKYIVSKVV
jgi:YHS domain-containing protein